MKKIYYLLISGACLLQQTGQAQSWKPFRQGLIYAYQVSNATASSETHTLRVDSAYVTTGGDSVYTFNRMMRRAPEGDRANFYKSRNNLFGSRLEWRPGTSDYRLVVNLDPTAGQGATTLLLRPRVAVGTTWTAGQNPLVTATLTSRTLQSFGSPTVTDSLATITLSNGQVVRLSRRYGLLAATELVYPYAGASKQYVQSQLPAPLLQSAYSPLALFDMQAGDEIGYVEEPFSYGGLPCSRTYTLRRIKSRQQTADSLVYTFQEQSRTETFSVPGCNNTVGNTLGPVTGGRLAVSLRTGQLQVNRAISNALPMLSGEYRLASSTGNDQRLIVGMGLLSGNSSGCFGPGLQPAYQIMYRTSTAMYTLGLDALAWQQAFSSSLGLGELYGSKSLQYYSRTRGTALTTCGSRASFGTLLPTHKATTAPAFQVFPNPTSANMTLQLATAVPAGSRLVLLDAVGRCVWQTTLATGQTQVLLPLQEKAAGLYVAQLRTADGSARALQVQKLP
ncbi:T9SS type A sorting domain-containing protein [Hymenobacter metallicola]|uniref:T9SS type A sorting domain-containing protein n=1 Tax=Hymenobacter metallicola TaxID=2563114 RepID=A0A4Z0Q2D2_9BACT|nr:T9SS type A sorting domain-containing protein [Hymenobacter metallicola]TGE23283.1 T9SS type A sorting domain-containing protein [Hymenobacter metallicola]